MTSPSLLRRLLVLTVCLASFFTLQSSAAPLKVAYSDWPGWVAWEIAIQKNWFKDAGVDVEFLWFEYGPSMDAFTAGKVDAVMVTNGDALVTGANGAKNVMIMLTDYSNGNDMIVGGPGIKSLKDLKGKKVGVEIGLVEHLLLLNGLKKIGMSETDVTLVPTPTNQTPQVLASGQVAAIGAWQPNSGQALNAVAGSAPIYTSADEPGLIYDVVTASPQSFSQHREEWKKFISVWEKVLSYINDPATKADAIKIMSSRVGTDPKVYAAFLAGTHFVGLKEGSKLFTSKTSGFDSLLGSSKIANDFNVKNAVYKESQDVATYIDGSIEIELAAAAK